MGEDASVSEAIGACGEDRSALDGHTIALDDIGQYPYGHTRRQRVTVCE